MLDPLRLRFRDARTERLFRRYQQRPRLSPLRVVGAGGLAIMLVFAMIGLATGSLALAELLVLQAAMTLPLAALLVASFLRPRRAWPTWVALAMAIVGAADAALVLLVEPAQRAIHAPGLLLLVAIAYTSLRLPLRLACATGASISLAGLYVLVVAIAPLEAAVTGLFYLLAINAVGVLAAHRREYLLRRHFLDMLRLQRRRRELTRMARRLERLSLRDELTGLPNRREAMARLASLLAAAARSGRPVTVAMLDLDRFKEVNDRHGHAAGDELLRRVAVSLRAGVRGSDAAFRLGGDEFVILMPATELAEGVAVVERALASLRATPEVAESGIGFSAGCAESEVGCSAESVLARADAELYRAKRCGRGRVCGDWSGAATARPLAATA